MIPAHEFINFALCHKIETVVAQIMRKDEVIAYFWKAEEPKDGMVSLLKKEIGPREWSPRKTEPFSKVVEVERGDYLRLAVFGGGTTMDWDIGPVPHSGVVAVLPSPEEVKNQLTS